MRRPRSLFLLLGVAGLALASCGDDDGTSAAQGGGGDRPVVAVTTNILGGVVEHVAGDQVDVETIIPVGADPHAFQASARQANEMREADALIVNGGEFEEGLVDVIDAASDDTPTFEAISAVETMDFGEGGHDHDHEGEGVAADGEEHEHADEGEGEHADEGDHDHDHAAEGEGEDDHADEGEHGHDHSGTDPHFFTDPVLMAEAVDAMAEFLIDNVEGIDAEALGDSADEYIAELEALHAEVEDMLADVPDERRVLITDHDVFGYFAERYDFEVVGTIIPTGTTADAASAGELAELAEVVEEEDVPAIFVGTTVSDGLAETLADEVGGDVEVVELFTGSVGEESSGAATYLEYVRTNAERITEALAS